MRDWPTSLQYRLGVQIGNAVAAALADGMSYREAISTLRHAVAVTEMNEAVGRDFTKEVKGENHDES